MALIAAVTVVFIQSRVNFEEHGSCVSSFKRDVQESLHRCWHAPKKNSAIIDRCGSLSYPCLCTLKLCRDGYGKDRVPAIEFWHDLVGFVKPLSWQRRGGCVG